MPAWASITKGELWKTGWVDGGLMLSMLNLCCQTTKWLGSSPIAHWSVLISCCAVGRGLKHQKRPFRQITLHFHTPCSFHTQCAGMAGGVGRTARSLQGQANSSAIANKSAPSNIKCDGFFQNFLKKKVKVKKTNVRKWKKIVKIVVRWRLSGIV